MPGNLNIGAAETIAKAPRVAPGPDLLSGYDRYLIAVTGQILKKITL